eukprot:10194047-Alexandrium_andersonii.AAC.1
MHNLLGDESAIAVLLQVIARHHHRRAHGLPAFLHQRKPARGNLQHARCTVEFVAEVATARERHHAPANHTHQARAE